MITTPESGSVRFSSHNSGTIVTPLGNAPSGIDTDVGALTSVNTYFGPVVVVVTVGGATFFAAGILAVSEGAVVATAGAVVTAAGAVVAAAGAVVAAAEESEESPEHPVINARLQAIAIITNTR